MSSLATGIPSFGTLIKVSDGASPNVFQTIAGVKDITISSSTSKAETTTHSSGIPMRTYVPTLLEPGQIKFVVNFDPSHASHSLTSDYGLEYLWRNRVRTRPFRLETIKADGSIRIQQFIAFVENIEASFPVEGIQTRNITLQISGDVEDV